MGGARYNSVGFFEEFIAGGGAGQRVPVRMGIVSFEELVERGGYVAHLSWLSSNRCPFRHVYCSVSCRCVFMSHFPHQNSILHEETITHCELVQYTRSLVLDRPRKLPVALALRYVREMFVGLSVIKVRY